MKKERPNWIKGRARCNPTTLLADLRKTVEQDVGEFNESGVFEPILVAVDWTEKYPDRFNVVLKDGDRLYQGTHDGGDSVSFLICGDGVDVQRYLNWKIDPTFQCHVTVRWNADSSEVQYLLDGSRKELWEITRLALERMFFRKDGSGFSKTS